MENFDIKPHIVESMTEIFETMLSLSVELADVAAPDISEKNRMVSAVNFTGGVNGALNIQVKTDFAVTMAASMQGIDIEEIKSDEEIKDLIAEISNILGGNLKSALNDAGYPCGISTPAITYGTDFSIESLNLQKFKRFLFKCQQDMITVEVGVQERPGADEENKSLAPDASAAPRKLDIEKIQALDVKSKVTDAIIEVFDTMFSIDIGPVDTVELSELRGVRNVGSVSFTGDVNGQINIQMTEEFSRLMTAKMLGMEEEDLESNEETKDMIGEISNILGGNLKSEFSDSGLICEISIPAFTTGRDFIIESFNMKHYDRFAFAHQENIVFVELGIKYSDELQIEKPDGEVVHFSVNEPADEPVETPEKQQALEPQPALQPDTSIPEEPAADIVDRRDEAERQTKFESKPQEEMQAVEDFDLNLLLDIPLEITIELGRSKIKIQELLDLGPGSTVTLSKLEGEPVDVLANDKLIARGEVVLQNKKYGIRITEITSRMTRIQSLT